MKTIVFAGINRCDFAYYAAKILHTISEKIVVVDNSDDKELFNAVLNPLTDEDREIYRQTERDGITYIRDYKFSPEFNEAFDYVLIYQGDYLDESVMVQSDLVFLMPDYKPSSLEQVKGLPGNAEYILFDRAGKLTEKAVAITLEVPEDKVIGGLDYDDKDYGCYLNLLYNGRQKLSGLSESYIQALAYVVEKAADVTNKEAMKITKKARK